MTLKNGFRFSANSKCRSTQNCTIVIAWYSEKYSGIPQRVRINSISLKVYGMCSRLLRLIAYGTHTHTHTPLQFCFSELETTAKIESIRVIDWVPFASTLLVCFLPISFSFVGKNPNCLSSIILRLFPFVFSDGGFLDHLWDRYKLCSVST